MLSWHPFVQSPCENLQNEDRVQACALLMPWRCLASLRALLSDVLSLGIPMPGQSLSPRWRALRALLGTLLLREGNAKALQQAARCGGGKASAPGRLVPVPVEVIG